MILSEILTKLSKKIEDDCGVLPVLANIATAHDDDSTFDKSSIVFSIVNIEEDKTNKNQSLYKNGVVKVSVDGEDVDSKEKYKKPAQNLIFSVLFTSYIKGAEQYTDGLNKLEQVVRYLQNNNVFYFDTNTLYEQSENVPIGIESNKLIIDLISLKTDQLNQMWSYLGSKYMPSILYTIRLLREQNETVSSSPIINEVKTQLWKNNKNDATGELESGTFKG